MNRPIIAFYSPRAQSGKTTASRHLCKLIGAKKTSFADPMKEATAQLMTPFFPGGEGEAWEWMSDDRKDNAIIPALGVTLRHVLVTLGTGWGRTLVHPDMWVKITEDRIRRFNEMCPVVVDDLRFPNEYAMLRKRGALLVRLYRPDAENGAPNEGQLEHHEFDYHIKNDGSLAALDAKIEDLVRRHFGDSRGVA